MPATLGDNIETWDHIEASFGEAFRRGLRTLPERVNQLMRWIAKQDADNVFLVAHGDFLNSGIEQVAEGGSAPNHSWRNCEVREFTLVLAADNECHLMRAGRSGRGGYKELAPIVASSSTASWGPFAEELQALAPTDLPRVFVFDLDDIIWRGDLDQTGGPPLALDLDEGQKLMSANGTFVTPFAHVSEIFSWIEENGHMAALASAGGQEDKWPGCDCTENALQLITTRSGRSLADIMPVRRIHFSKSKDVTLTEIAEECGCEPRDMVFFDNSMARVKEALAVGITTCYCPAGLSWTAFVLCTNEYARRRRKGEKKAKYVKA
jgi:magnesium-dependent phosphatase-1